MLINPLHPNHLKDLREKAFKDIDLSGLKRGTINWLFTTRGCSLYIYTARGRARAGDILRRLNLPADKDSVKILRIKFLDLTKAGFLIFEQNPKKPDKIFSTTAVGAKLMQACQVILRPLREQSLALIQQVSDDIIIVDTLLGELDGG